MKHENCRVYNSLGMKRYLSAVKYASFVLGNSSSGIIEAPSLKTPTINIGDRQKGRIMAESIISCNPDMYEINVCIKRIDGFELKNIRNPYEMKYTAKSITAIITDYLINDKIELQKSFYDLSLECE